jgi:hypothetical protein
LTASSESVPIVAGRGDPELRFGGPGAEPEALSEVDSVGGRREAVLPW